MERTRSIAILPLILIGLLTGGCGQSGGASATSPPTVPSRSPTISASPPPSLSTFLSPSPTPSVSPGVGASGGPSASTSSLDVSVVSGPACPVQRNPPDPGCAPRPVPNATIVVRDAGGAELARASSDQSGHIRLPLPAGVYTIEALPVQGLMGTPSPVSVTVAGSGVTPLELTYDTGIR